MILFIELTRIGKKQKIMQNVNHIVNFEEVKTFNGGNQTVETRVNLIGASSLYVEETVSQIESLINSAQIAYYEIENDHRATK